MRLRRDALEMAANEIEIVETFNARLSHPRWNQVRLTGRSRATYQDRPGALESGVPVGTWTHPAIAFACQR